MGIRNSGSISSLVWRQQARGVWLPISCAVLLSILENLPMILPHHHPLSSFDCLMAEHSISRLCSCLI